MSTTRQPRFFEMNRYTSVIQSILTNKEKARLIELGYVASDFIDPEGHARLKQVIADNRPNCCHTITCGLCKPKGCFCVTLGAITTCKCP